RRRHTRFSRDWSSDVCSSDLYLLEDRPVANLSAAERARIRNRRIGFIFQAFNLIGDLTVYENVELPLTYRGMGGAERKQRSQVEIGRASCRERGEVAVGGVAI